MKKIDDAYRNSSGYVYWFQARDPYFASITTTLTVILNQRMYMLTNESQFLTQALFDYAYFVDRPYLFNEYGLLKDGRNADGTYIDDTVYTYNQGTMIMIYGHFYQIYKDVKYLKLGIRHA